MRLLYEILELPIFQNKVYATREEALTCHKGDVRLVEDEKTGLVFNECFSPDIMIYDKDYQNEQALSNSFRIHLESVARIVERYLGKENLIEVGCGKGYFLEMLLERSVDIIGFDPTYEGINPRVQKCYFSLDCQIQAKGLILRHVLEHIQDPIKFLMDLCAANGGKGLIYIEVPCFDWICKNRAWFDIFYEHVNYFRLSDFYRIFAEIIASGYLFGDQYLYVVADLSKLRVPKIDLNNRVVFPANFLTSLEELAKKHLEKGAVWGSSSKGVIFSLLMKRNGNPIDIIIDINPAKQGRFLPTSGLLVQSPKEAFGLLTQESTIFIMNSNYLSEIKEMSNNAYHYVIIDQGD
jgi:hypothetical protein